MPSNQFRTQSYRAWICPDVLYVFTDACLLKLGDTGSILGRTETWETQIEEKELYRYIDDISKWLDFRVFSDKDVKS
jgi:hypothetical protein